MIIDARDDVVSLRGTLNENHWDAIAAAVDLLLPEHPQGILMNCSGITCMTDMGGTTFMNGLSYMEAYGARIILCCIPEAVAEKFRAIPGLHSQLPTAPTVEAGRQSLGAACAAPLKATGKSQVILVPVSPPFSAAAANKSLVRLQPGPQTEIHLIYVLTVPRSLPIGAPLPEEEAKADEVLTEAEKVIRAASVARHVARGRNIPDALVEASEKLQAAEVIAGLDSSAAGDESVAGVMDGLRSRCPCAITVRQEKSSLASPPPPLDASRL